MVLPRLPGSFDAFSGFFDIGFDLALFVKAEHRFPLAECHSDRQPDITQVNDHTTRVSYVFACRRG
jgi:hypothetical protein